MDDYDFLKYWILSEVKRFMETGDKSLIHEMYDPALSLMVFGTARNGIIRSYQELIDSGIIDATLAVDKIKIENVDLLQLEIINDLALMAYTYDFKYSNEGIEFQHFMRVTQVMQKTDNGWKVKQFHNSFPQFGETTDWPSISGLNQDLLDIINKYQIDAQQLLSIDNQKRVFEYLMKARELISSMTIK